MTAEFRLRGRHVLVITVCFFAVVIAANAALVYVAVRSFPGENEKKSYRQGLQYNAVLGERAVQEALGWRASIDTISRDGEQVRFVVSFQRQDGAPLGDLDLAGMLHRPVSGASALAPSFTALGGGRYEALIAAPSGAFDLTVTARAPTGERFEFTNRVMAP